jgi:hypothetical protein
MSSTQAMRSSVEREYPSACLLQEVLAAFRIRPGPISRDNGRLLEQLVVHDRSSAVVGGD